MKPLFLDVCGSFIERNERKAAYVAQELGKTLVFNLLGEPQGWKLEVELMEEEYGTLDVRPIPTVT